MTTASRVIKDTVLSPFPEEQCDSVSSANVMVSLDGETRREAEGESVSKIVPAKWYGFLRKHPLHRKTRERSTKANRVCPRARALLSPYLEYLSRAHQPSTRIRARCLTRTVPNRTLQMRVSSPFATFAFAIHDHRGSRLSLKILYVCPLYF